MMHRRSRGVYLPRSARFIVILSAAGLTALLGLMPAPVASQPADINPQQLEAIRQQLIESLKSAGLSRAEIDKLLVDMGYAPLQQAQPSEAVSETRIVREFEDGSPMYLPVGGKLELTLEEGQYAELPFVSDGPGMLTIVTMGGEGLQNLQLQVRSESTGDVGIDMDASSAPGSRIIPIPLPGNYVISVAGNGQPIQVAAEWLPFPGLTAPQFEQPFRPDLSDMVVLQANTQINAQLADERPRYFMIQPDRDGQLSVDVEGNQGDIQLGVSIDGDLSSEMLIYDDDLNGNLSREVANFPAEAGRVYHIRVSPSEGQGITLRVRTTLIPDAEETEQE